MSLLQSAHQETTTVQDSDQLYFLRFSEPREVMPFTIYRVTINTLKTFFATVFGLKAGSTTQEFSVQKLTFPNGFTIETDENFLYVKKNGIVCSKVSLTAHLAPDHQEL